MVIWVILPSDVPALEEWVSKSFLKRLGEGMDRSDESWPGQSEEDNQVTAGRAKVSKVLQADKDVEDAGEEEEAVLNG